MTVAETLRKAAARMRKHGKCEKLLFGDAPGAGVDPGTGPCCLLGAVRSAAGVNSHHSENADYMSAYNFLWQKLQPRETLWQWADAQSEAAVLASLDELADAAEQEGV